MLKSVCDPAWRWRTWPDLGYMVQRLEMLQGSSQAHSMRARLLARGTWTRRSRPKQSDGAGRPIERSPDARPGTPARLKPRTPRTEAPVCGRAAAARWLPQAASRPGCRCCFQITPISPAPRHTSRLRASIIHAPHITHLFTHSNNTDLTQGCDGTFGRGRLDHH